MTTVDNVVIPSGNILDESVGEIVPTVPDTVHLPPRIEEIEEIGEIQQIEERKEPSPILENDSPFGIIPEDINIWQSNEIPSSSLINNSMNQKENDDLNNLLNDMEISDNHSNTIDPFGYSNSSLWQRLAMLKPGQE